MKKLLFLLSITLFTNAFVACNNCDTSFSDLSKSPESYDIHGYNAIKEQIDSLGNQKFTNQVGLTRGNFLCSFWNGLKAVLIADGKGASEAMKNKKEILINTIGSSLEKAIDLISGTDSTLQAQPQPQPMKVMSSLNYEIPYNTDYTDSVIIADSKNFDDSLGYYHNKVISSALSKNSDASYWSNMTTECMLDTLISETESVLNMKKGTLLLSEEGRRQIVADVNSIRMSKSTETADEMVRNIKTILC